MTGLHYEMLDILSKRLDLFMEDEKIDVLVYETTGSSTIDGYLLDIINGIHIDVLKAKIKSDFKLDKYTEALIYAFQQINDKKPFTADDIFAKFTEN